jgi:hypothetical protein
MIKSMVMNIKNKFCQILKKISNANSVNINWMKKIFKKLNRN